MKRLLSGLLAAGMMLALAGCGEPQAEGTATPEPAPTPTATPAPAPTPVVLPDGLELEISGVGPFGVLYGRERGNLYTVSDQGLDDLSTPLPDRLPVYVCKYPHCATGPDYEMTEEMQEEAFQKALRYLKLLYPGREEYDFTWRQKPHIFSYTIDDAAEVAGQIDKIDVYLTGYDLPEDVTDEALLEDPYVKAAIEFFGLEEPQITGRYVAYNKDGTLICCEYEIGEPAEDFLTRAANRRFAGIHVRKNGTDYGGYTWITLYGVGEPELLREAPALPYEVVWAGVKERIPDMRWQEELQIDPSMLKDEEVLCEIFYSYPPVDSGLEGFMPYYRFYAKIGTGEQDPYLCFEVRVAEKTES